MVYGKLGVTPLILHAQSRMIMFWARIYITTAEAHKNCQMLYMN